MSNSMIRKVCFSSSCLLVASQSAHAQVDLAVFDASLFGTNGFSFGAFDEAGALDTSGGTFDIDLNSGGDLFGGFGSDISADAFAAADALLEVTLEVGALNAATNFRVILTDSDDDFTGDEFQFYFDLTGVTPESGFVTLSQPLLTPGPVFNQAQFGKFIGDEIQNYDGGIAGLAQMQIQSEFGGTDRLNINVSSVNIVDPNLVPDPTLIELTTDTYASQPSSFDFGTFQDTGALDVSGENIIINADATSSSGPTGGLGFNGLNVDFDTAEYQIEVEAKLLAGNTAGVFNVLLGDNDGDDSGPGLGSEDYIFAVDTADLNDTDFTTIVIPLGSGTETDIVTTFGFTNGGDGLQNFDLSQLQLQTDEADLGLLALEVARVSIVEIINDFLTGDYNGDGFVSQGDLDLVLLNWGDSALPGGFTEGALDGGGPFDGLISQNELDGVLLNWGSGVAPDLSAIPEPASAALLGLMGAVLVRRRRSAT